MSNCCLHIIRSETNKTKRNGLYDKYTKSRTVNDKDKFTKLLYKVDLCIFLKNDCQCYAFFPSIFYYWQHWTQKK